MNPDRRCGPQRPPSAPVRKAAGRLAAYSITTIEDSFFHRAVEDA